MTDRRAAVGMFAALAYELMAATATAAEVAFLGATVIDGTGRTPIANAQVVVSGERIVTVGPRPRQPPPSVRAIDVTGKWIIPGMIDAHVHFFQSGGLYARPDIIDLRARRPYAEETADVRARIGETLARYLASGITAVVDVGGPMWNFAVREQARRTPTAPRIAVAGPLLATFAPPQLTGDDPPIVRIRTADEARAEVRRQLALGPDLIKIWFVFPGPDIEPEMGWVRAAIKEAHAGGARVVAHATQRRVARAVVTAGIDILAHGIDDGPIDAGLLALIKAKGVIYTTTLGVHGGYARVFGRVVKLNAIERRLGDPRAIASFADLARVSRRPTPPPFDPVAGSNLGRVRAHGVVVAAGSDAGNIGTLHGPALHRELALMVEGGGLTPLEALIAATRGGAAVMGRSTELGTLEPGKLADMVILDGDPLADIRNTRRIFRVVKGGVILDPSEIISAVSVP